MKQLFYIVFFLILLRAVPAAGQTAPIPDPVFLNFLKTNYPATINASDELIIAQAAAVTGTLAPKQIDIVNLEGIQYFTGITTLDVDDNQLTDVSQVSTLTNLQVLRLENNFLTSLPDLSNLVNLRRLIVFDNNLQSVPDLSNNTLLQELNLDNNSLTDLPDLGSLAALNNLKLRNNYFSFEDLIPFVSFSGTISMSPQKKIPPLSSNITVYENGTLTLSTGLDLSLSGVIYEWYFNGTPIGTVNNDSFVIVPVDFSHEGKYNCVISYPSFAFSINTDTVFADVLIYPTLNPQFSPGKISCVKSGTLEVTLASWPAPPYVFYLASPVTGDTLVSNTGYFEGLTQPEYILIIKSGSGCQEIFPARVQIPFEECKEDFITPNGDGDKDAHYFAFSGTAVIYDKNGNIVKTLSIPGEWDGASQGGALVAPGYYSVDINKGEHFINISVLY